MRYARVVVSRTGGPEVLEMVSSDVPEPRAGEARVRVLAAGVSYGDVLARAGVVPDAPKPPFTPGYDVTGTVDRLGPEVTSVTAGTQVTALLNAGGGYAEFVCLPADRLVPVPNAVDAVHSAGTVLNYFVAYQMLHRLSSLKPGQRILVHGAAGGVGTALLQLARHAGLHTFGTASAAKHQIVSDQGAVPLDYQREDAFKRVRGLTGDGVDAVYDPIGGASFLRSYRALRAGGQLVAYGVSRALKDGRRNRVTAYTSFVSVKALGLLPARRATFYTANSLEKSQPNAYREDLAAVLRMLAAGEIEPVIAERIPLAQVARARELLERSAVSGKIILTCAHP